jgi:hypothetical protein
MVHASAGALGPNITRTNSGHGSEMRNRDVVAELSKRVGVERRSDPSISSTESTGDALAKPSKIIIDLKSISYGILG